MRKLRALKKLKYSKGYKVENVLESVTVGSKCGVNINVDKNDIGKNVDTKLRHLRISFTRYESLSPFIEELCVESSV